MIAPRPRAVADQTAGDGAPLKAGARRIVETMARNHPQWLTKSQIGVLAKFKVTGGTFLTYWSAIRRAGYVEDRNDGREFRVTEAGLAFAGVDAGNPLTIQEVLDQWRSSLKAGARTMLDVLLDNPYGITRADLAEAVGMAATGGTFNTYLSTLRRNGLAVEEDGLLTAADIITAGGEES